MVKSRKKRVAKKPSNKLPSKLAQVKSSNDASAQQAHFASLRADMGLTQEQFARKLKLTRTAVLHWESGYSQPSADKYLYMGSMALKLGRPDWRWFFERANVDIADLYKISRDFVKDVERNEAAIRKNDLFYARLLSDLKFVSEPKLAPAEAVEMLVPLPSNFALSSDSIVCLRIPNELSSLSRDPNYQKILEKLKAEGKLEQLAHQPRPKLFAPIFKKGDIAIVDSSFSNLSDLKDELVAFSFSYQTKCGSTASQEEWSKPTLHVAWLRYISESPNLLRDVIEYRKQRNEMLEKYGLAREEEEHRGYYYFFPTPDTSNRPFPITSIEPEPKLSEGYTILGKVVGWIAGRQP